MTTQKKRVRIGLEQIKIRYSVKDCNPHVSGGVNQETNHTVMWTGIFIICIINLSLKLNLARNRQFQTTSGSPTDAVLSGASLIQFPHLSNGNNNKCFITLQGHYSNCMSFAFSNSFSRKCTRYEKSITVVSGSTLQFIFKEILMVKFGYNINDIFWKI